MKPAIFKLAATGMVAAALALPAAAQGEPPAVCGDTRISVYFPAYETRLTPQSQQVIDAVSDQLKGCYVSAVTVNVLSEEAHTDEESASLSEARANNVMTALLDQGIEPASYKADYARVEAEAPSAAPAVEPMARRVSVAFTVRPGYGV